MITFDCNLISETENYQCEIPYIDKETINGQDIYINKNWTGGEVLICYFLFIFLIIKISEIIFNFFMPKIIKIRKK
jgi:hypothetical protein